MSSTIFATICTEGLSRYILDDVPKVKEKTLTVRFDDKTYAEFAVAIDLLRVRSMSNHVHNFAINTIGEAKKVVSEDRFNELVESKMAELEKKSKKKAAERRNGLRVIGKAADAKASKKSKRA